MSVCDHCGTRLSIRATRLDRDSTGDDAPTYVCLRCSSRRAGVKTSEPVRNHLTAVHERYPDPDVSDVPPTPVVDDDRVQWFAGWNAEGVALFDSKTLPQLGNEAWIITSKQDLVPIEQ